MWKIRHRSTALRGLAMLLAMLAGARLPAFDSNGTTDIVWQNITTGETAIWFMDFTRLTSTGRITNDFGMAWQIAAAEDFNRDGHTDLLWRNPVTGENTIWLMRGTNRVERRTLRNGSTDYYVVGAGDFNNDGQADILWRHKSADIMAAWLMDGASWNGQIGWITPSGDLTWRPVATGDFNRDGDSDILWRHQLRGNLAVWFMSKTNRIRSVEMAGDTDLENELVGVGHFNPLGNIDLLWRHKNGTNSIWQMSGTNRLSVSYLHTERDSSWTIRGTGGYTNSTLLAATSSTSPPALTLAWQHGPAPLTNIRQRPIGIETWTNLMTARDFSARRFSATNLAAGARYEFNVGDSYLLAGNRATPIHHRGRVILIAEDSAAKALGHDLNRFKTNLIGDGWIVTQTNVPRHDDVRWPLNTNRIASIKAFITNTYYADPGRTKAVILLGHVPIPYSGDISPDGHGSRAFPADGYYGDVDGGYSDNIVTRTNWSRDRRHANVPGDGKFDQAYYPNKRGGPGELELAVGRIDFAKLTTFSGRNEMDLLRQYLAKNDRYRRKQFTVPSRVVVGTYFVSPAPEFLNRNVFNQAQKLGSRLFGIAPETVIEGDALGIGTAGLWGFIGGNGLPYSIRGQNGLFHLSRDFASPENEPKIPFCAFYGSYFADWDCTNNLMRAFLGAPRYSLAALWFNAGYDGNQIELGFEQLGLGEILGSGLLRTAKQNPYADMTHIALLGDPTLRMQILAPPSELSAHRGSKVTLQWKASPEAVGYFVYRSMNSLNGPWQILNHEMTRVSSFTDSSPPSGAKLYQVRAAALVTSGSGSFTNLSQGIFIGLK